LFPLKGTLSQREAPDTIYLITGSADVMLGQAEAYWIEQNKKEIRSSKLQKQKYYKTTKPKLQKFRKTHNHRIGHVLDGAVKEVSVYSCPASMAAITRLGVISPRQYDVV
jgi:hypothetical protein